jgi:AcrR family transcriptional regulator
MGKVAREAGVSRAALHRRWGSRDRLLAEVMWRGFEGMYAVARRLHSGDGPEAVVEVIEDVLGNAADDPVMRRFVDEHPKTALRVLTSLESPFQQRVTRVVTEIILEEMGEPEGISAADLAYAVQRIAEAFYHRELLVGERADIGLGLKIISKLLAAYAASGQEARAL